MTLVLRDPNGMVRRVNGIVEIERVVTGGVYTGSCDVPDTPVVKVMSLAGAVLPEAVESILK